jgi:hypothetical protein
MKNCLLLLVSLLFINLGFSQEVQSFRLGLKMSPNVGCFKPDTKGITSNGAKTSFGYGLMADFTIGNSYNYAFSTCIELSSNTGSIKFADIVSPTAPDTSISQAINTSEYSIRYVTIPLTIKMKTNEIGYSTYFANFGISTGLRVKSRKNESFALAAGDLTNENVDVLADISPIRIGMVIGGGVEYNFHGKTALVAGLSFNNGVTNIFKKNYHELNSDGTVALLNGTPISTIKQKAISNYISLDIGIMF